MLCGRRLHPHRGAVGAQEGEGAAGHGGEGFPPQETQEVAVLDADSEKQSEKLDLLQRRRPSTSRRRS